jgi:hypothetical protein
VALFADPTDATRAAPLVAEMEEAMSYTPDDSEKRVIAWLRWRGE